MRKTISALLALVFCLALLTAAADAQGAETYPAIATNNQIVVSNSTDTPDAHMVHPAVYKIEGSNYFKLRDVAMLLSGSAKQFSVEYDDAAKAVSITSGKPYKAAGGELSGYASETNSAIVSNNTILINGKAVALTVFKIDGANYFKLRDLGEALDFHVGYDDHTKIVYISGARGYETKAETDGGDAASVPFAAQYIRTNGWHDGVQYPVVTLIGSTDELDRYIEEYGALYDLSHKETVYADTTIGFADAAEGYDEAWFAEHQLLLVLLEEGSGSVRHAVTKVTADPDPVIEIDRLVPEVGTADMAEWHILIETDRVFGAADGFTVLFSVKTA